jgi:hypothetical protein
MSDEAVLRQSALDLQKLPKPVIKRESANQGQNLLSVPYIVASGSI